MLVFAVGVDDDEVVLLPLVALAIVDLVTLAFEDVEVRFVLMTVPMVGAAGLQFDEVDLQRLGEERVIARTEHPPGARLALVRIPGMTDGRVVRDRPGTAHARRAALPGAELLEAIGFRTDPTQKSAAVLSSDQNPPIPR